MYVCRRGGDSIYVVQPLRYCNFTSVNYIFIKHKTIHIDCHKLFEQELNERMKVLLGFPDCYGMNWDAMIACLSNIHYPYEQISEVALGKDETLFIYCKDL